MARAAIVLFLLIPAGDNALADDDKLDVYGTWQMIDGEAGGRKYNQLSCKHRQWVIAKGTLTKVIVVGSDTEKEVFELIIDPSAEPKHFDIKYLEGANKGQVAKGIYKIESDVLTICYAIPNDMNRPGSFDSTNNRKSCRLYKFERIKAPQ